MEIKLTLALPHDEVSVPVVRRILSGALTTLGVAREDVDDVALALTEACANVLEHAQDSDEYEVSAGIDSSTVVIEVVDRGAGFDGSALGLDDAADGSEGGRGIQLMRALMDSISFPSRPQAGTVVHLEKALVLPDDAPLRLLGEPVEHGPWGDVGREEQ